MAVFTIGSSNLSGGSGSDPVSGGSALTTVGAVPYVSAAGVLNQDAGALFWDATNNRLGIGFATPAYPLQVDGTIAATELVVIGGNAYGLLVSGSTGYIRNASSGNRLITLHHTSDNVGIGSSSADGNYKLDVTNSGSTGTMRVWDQTATTGTTLAVVQAGQGQSGNLAEWRNYAGTAMHAVNSSGQLITATGTPASAAASGVAGTVVWDASFVYVCTATNTWKRVAIATW